MIRFSEIFAENVRVHGVLWTKRYYRKKGMEEWEISFWLGLMIGRMEKAADAISRAR